MANSLKDGPQPSFRCGRRPQLERSLKGMGTKFTTLVVWAVDRRTHRGLAEAGLVLDTLDEVNARLISNCGLDSESHGDKVESVTVHTITWSKNTLCSASRMATSRAQLTNPMPPGGWSDASAGMAYGLPPAPSTSGPEREPRLTILRPTISGSERVSSVPRGITARLCRGR